MIAVDYATFPATASTLFIALNAGLLSSSLANVGFTASENSFLSVAISNSIAQAPATLVVPAGATNSQGTVATQLGFRALRMAMRANAVQLIWDYKYDLLKYFILTIASYNVFI